MQITSFCKEVEEKVNDEVTQLKKLLNLFATISLITTGTINVLLVVLIDHHLILIKIRLIQL